MPWPGTGGGLFCPETVSLRQFIGNELVIRFVTALRHRREVVQSYFQGVRRYSEGAWNCCQATRTPQQQFGSAGGKFGTARQQLQTVSRQLGTTGQQFGSSDRKFGIALEESGRSGGEGARTWRRCPTPSAGRAKSVRRPGVENDSVNVNREFAARFGLFERTVIQEPSANKFSF